MLKYEDYLSKYFELGSSVEGSSFIRSDFDYGTRQRRAVMSYASHSAQIMLDYGQLLAFKSFWEDLNMGTDIFLTDMVVHGDATLEKQIRFTAPYSVSEWDKDPIFVVKCQFEIIRSGTARADQCPLTPSNFLLPENDITPC